MCGPFVLPMIGAAVSAAGSVYGGVMAKQQADYAAAAAKANAGAANQQGYAQAGAVRDQYGEVAAQQRAQLASAGVNVNSGTSDVLALETQKRTEQAAATQIWQGRSEATAYRNQAAVSTAQGKAAMTAGIIGGVGSILGGVEKGLKASGPFGGGALSLGVGAQTYTGPKPYPLTPGMTRPSGRMPWIYPGGRIGYP